MSTYGNPPRTPVTPGMDKPSTTTPPSPPKTGEGSFGRTPAGQIMENAKKETHELATSLKEGAATLKEGASTLKEKITGGSELGNRFREGVDSCRNYAVKNPGKAMLASMALGMIVAALRGRNGKRGR